MRCRAVREAINHLTKRNEMKDQPSLAAHVDSCPKCAEILRHHFALLELLTKTGDTLEPADLAGRVLSRLDEPPAQRAPVFRWAAVAACALAALALGFFFGQSIAGTSQANDSMASTYQAAFTGQTASSAELAYLEAGSRATAAVPTRSAP